MALEYMGPMNMSCFFGSYSVNRRSIPGYIKSRYLRAFLIE